MNLNDVKKYLEDNKDNADVQAYVSGLNPLSVDKLQQFVSNDENGKKWFDSERDKHFSKSLETWKTNNLGNLIDAEVKKRFPEKDAKDIELENIKSQLAKMQTEKTHESLLNKATKLANEKHLPLNLIDYFVGSDENTTKDNLVKFEKIWSDSLSSAVTAKLKDSSYTPPAGGSQGKTFTPDELKNMSTEEINKNWEQISKSLSQKQ